MVLFKNLEHLSSVRNSCNTQEQCLKPHMQHAKAEQILLSRNRGSVVRTGQRSYFQGNHLQILQGQAPTKQKLFFLMFL